MLLDKTERIKDLIKTLNEASVSYYKYDNPTMTDKQYDDLYDELLDLEKETGIIMSDSPTQKVQGETIEYLEKVQHGKPMLSADKTKDISKIKKFIGNKPCIMSWKEDGLTIVLRYKNGTLAYEERDISKVQEKFNTDMTYYFAEAIRPACLNNGLMQK